jgi:hypothetical protein
MPPAEGATNRADGGGERPGAVVAAWDQAAQVIAELAGSARGSGGVAGAVVGITGPVGAGKSTLAARLSGSVLSTDDYLPDYERVPYDERDDPRHVDWGLLIEHLAELRAGRGASVPVWSFQSHRREGARVVEPAGLIVLEGIHALHERVRAALDVRVYVEAPAGVRWSRWEHLEATGQRGWGVEVARAFFDGVAEPTFAARADAYRAAAHVVVRNDAWRPGDGSAT